MNNMYSIMGGFWGLYILYPWKGFYVMGYNILSMARDVLKEKDNIYSIGTDRISKEKVKLILLNIKRMGIPVVSPHAVHLHSAIPKRTIRKGLRVLVALKKLEKVGLGKYMVMPSVWYNVGIDREEIEKGRVY